MLKDSNSPLPEPVCKARPDSRHDDSGYGGYGGGYGGGGYDGGYGGPSFGEEDGGDGRKRYGQIAERSRCRFCREKSTRVDYKDVLTLQKLCTNQGRIFSRKRSGNCASHQRLVKKAIKQARFIGLLTYTS